MNKPFIGLTCSLKEERDSSTASIGDAYVRSIQAAGGLPVLLPPWTPVEDVPALLDRLDGVLLIGGPDIDPALYGQEKHEKTRLLAARRQAFDLALARAAMDRDLPLMGVCLGCQEVAIAAGGSLIQHLPDAGAWLQHAGKPTPRHGVFVEPGSRLERALGRRVLVANSSHHQAIADPGENMRVVAWAYDGTIEAAESRAHRFVLAIQWHPERLIDEPAHMRLFEALVAAARGAAFM